jgi:hypothetical protein
MKQAGQTTDADVPSVPFVDAGGRPGMVTRVDAPAAAVDDSE